MTESILKSIIKLYAIFSQLLPDNKQNIAADIVRSYLEHLININRVNQLLSIYRFYSKEFIERSKKRQKHKDPLFTVKTVLICEQLNKQLLQKQKIPIILQLLDILSYKNDITESDLDLIKTLALTLHFNEETFNDCKAFVFDSIDNIIVKDSVLLIDNAQDPVLSGIKHWQQKNLKGNVIFLYIEETHDFVFRLYGHDDQLFLNGVNITPGRTYGFNKGSVLRSALMGTIYYTDITRIFFSNQSELNFTFSAKDLEFKFKYSDNGILPFSLSLRSGQLVGIMGGSGVGKSTLLNLLNGNLKPLNGKVLINEYDVHKDKEKLKGIIGYVPQEDLLIEELTVYQNLYFNAKLCFGDLNSKEIDYLVIGMLSELDLYDIKDMPVGGPINKFISGGQRKRLNISLELIREPFLLFVDEPTSGLSSTDSDLIMDLLIEQAQKGKLVVMNIHQPSSDIFRLLDKLIVIDKGGRIIYHGNPSDALIYFKTTRHLINADAGECITCGNLNPEQILQIVEAKKIGETGKYTDKRVVTPEVWYDLYKKNIESVLESGHEVNTRIPPGLLKIPDKFNQFKIFSFRNFLSKLSDRQYMLINLVEAPLLAFILGIFTRYNAGNENSEYAYIFSENVNLPVYIFMSVIVVLFLGLMISAEEIIRDRKIIQREAFLHLSKYSYYNSKLIWLLALSAVQTFSFILVGNWIMGIKGMLIPYWLILFSAAVFSNVVGLNISDSLKSVVSIYVLIPLLLVPQILLGGAMVKFDKMNKRTSSQEYVPFIGDLMTSRWAYEALSVYQFTNNKYEKHFYHIEMKESQSSFNVNYLLPELQIKLEKISNQENSSDAGNNYLKNINILRNELYTLARYDDNIRLFKDTKNITPISFNSGLASELTEYLKKLREYYIKVMNASINQRDLIIEDLTRKIGGKDKVLLLKQNYYNDKLAEQVLNKRDYDKITQYKYHLVQKAEPGFHIPESRYGRAQFFAPYKRIGSETISTYSFNLMVIWIFNIIFYLSLQFGILKKGIDSLNNFGFKGLKSHKGQVHT